MSTLALSLEFAVGANCSPSRGFKAGSRLTFTHISSRTSPSRSLTSLWRMPRYPPCEQERACSTVFFFFFFFFFFFSCFSAPHPDCFCLQKFKYFNIGLTFFGCVQFQCPCLFLDNFDWIVKRQEMHIFPSQSCIIM